MSHRYRLKRRLPLTRTRERVEKNNGEELLILSSGPWVTTITLRYMLGGESKEKEIEVRRYPDVRFPEFDPIAVETSGRT